MDWKRSAKIPARYLHGARHGLLSAKVAFRQRICRKFSAAFEGHVVRKFPTCFTKLGFTKIGAVMKWIKRIVMWAVALVLVLFIAAVAFVATFDPNDYKDKISSIIQEKTGRNIELGGPIKLTLFPWLGVSVRDVALGNAPGFPQKDMVTAKTVEVKAAFLPLLRGQFEVGKLVLDGATIHLARNSNGVTNWADLLSRPSAAQSGTSSSPAPASTGGATALAIGGVEINDANLDWQDAVTGQSLALQHLNLDSGAIRLGQAVDMSLNFSYTTQDPKLGKLTGDVRLSSSFDMKAQWRTALCQIPEVLRSVVLMHSIIQPRCRRKASLMCPCPRYRLICPSMPSIFLQWMPRLAWKKDLV
jgi:Uncharacterized protein involved in outer membrane biogenesis